MLLVLPMYIMPRVHMRRWKRICVYVLFGLGALLIGIGGIRLITAMIPSAKLVGGPQDTMIWGSIEIAVTTLISTLPPIYILLRHRFQGDTKPQKLLTTDVGPASESDIPLDPYPYQPAQGSPFLGTVDSRPPEPRSQEAPFPIPGSSVSNSFSRSPQKPPPRSTNGQDGKEGQRRHDALTAWYVFEQDRPPEEEITSLGSETGDAEVRVATEITRNRPQSGERPRIVTIQSRANR
ncbi:hypothetical protein F5Y17DRAFT_102115 [Xylariaceae sp. FL0594]|nr:hypothetical protein F5Y17DRAFT_102115 [Xylariaceae sp. FL0594]